MGRIIGITGTPGTGKKTVATLVAPTLRMPSVSLNDLAAARGLTETGEEGALVDVSALGRVVRREIKSPSVVFGHLLPQVLSRSDVSRVFVLRCEPSVLKQRLLSRGYRSAKAVENVEAELIGLIAAEAYDSFGKAKTAELDTTTSTPSSVSRSVVGMVSRSGVTAGPPIDWLVNYDSGAKLTRLLS